MSEAQDGATQKLQRGHKILTSGPGDSDVLSLAFIRLHGALEDRLRELLANRLPRQRLDIFDLKTFTWKEILEHSKTHLGISEADADFIGQANTMRNQVAHGGDFSWTRDRIIQYEQLITQLWATGSRASLARPSPVDSLRPSHPPTRPGFSPFRTTKPAVSGSVGRAPSFHPAQSSWFRSKRFFYLSLMALLAAVFLFTAGFFAWRHLELIQYFTNATTTPTPVPATRTPLPRPTEETSPSPTITDTPAAIQAAPEEQETTLTEGCQIVWVETPGDELDKMNRAMAWNEVVSAQVSGSGMEPGQFYRLVAEQNPFLAADGFVFLKGKTYLLPRCE